MSTLRPPDRAKFSPKKLASMSPVKVAALMEATVLLNEEDEILISSLVRLFQASGQSRRFWERNIEWSRAEGIYFPENALRVINVALDIVFRNEGTA